MSSWVCPKLPSYKLAPGLPGHCGQLGGHMDNCWTGAVLEISKCRVQSPYTNPQPYDQLVGTASP